MLFVSLRDLQWRRRRFLIGVLATGLVFALALIITGIAGSFHNEVSRSVKSFSADEWIVSDKATGPFTTPVAFPDTAVAQLRRDNPGITSATPLLALRFTVTPKRDVQDINVIAMPPGAPLWPKLHDGREPTGLGEITVDKSLRGVKVGDHLIVAGVRFLVVGRTSGLSYFGGTPVVVATLRDAQVVGLDGFKVASAIAVRGKIDKLPPGFKQLTNAEAIKDLRRPLKEASGTIDILRVLLWIVAAGIIGSVLYLQAIERTRDFAVFKATGVTSRSLVGGLGFQAIVLAICSAIVAIILSVVLAPLLPMTVETPGSAYVLLPIVAIVVGLLASVSGLRRAVGVDPALAFGG